MAKKRQGQPMLVKYAIPARMEHLKDGGYLAHCAWPMESGQPCGAPLGHAFRVSEKSIAWVQSNSPDPRVDPRVGSGWLLSAPSQSPKLSRQTDDDEAHGARLGAVSRAARGFSRQSDADGATFFRIIKPRSKRHSSDGSVVLDERGQFVPRRGGRVPMSRMYLTGREEDRARPGRYDLQGEQPPLPVVVECGDCRRLNIVACPPN